MVFGALTCVVSGVLFSVSATASDFPVGKIDLGAMRQRSSKIQSMVQEIRKLELDSQAQLQQIANDIKALEKKIEEESGKLKKEELDKLRQDLKAKKENQENETQVARVRVSFKKKSVDTTISQQFAEAIEKIAKQEKLKIVLPQGAFLYADGVKDITDMVIKELDAMAVTPEKKIEAPEAPKTAPPADKKASPPPEGKDKGGK
jgi:Skp family chaperone for outer membrane proteins